MISLLPIVSVETGRETRLMQSRVAIFIDAENVSAAHAAQIFRMVNSRGVLVARRAYGDFAKGAGAALAWQGTSIRDRHGTGLQSGQGKEFQ